MTARELLQGQLEETGYQLEACFAGLDGASWDAKDPDTAMSPRETALHLAEAYRAYTTHMDGGKHEWGSYRLEDSSLEGVLANWRKEREEATARALASDTDESYRLAQDYILLHDAYHVGQLATLRIRLGGWDPYSIYRH